MSNTRLKYPGQAFVLSSMLALSLTYSCDQPRADQSTEEEVLEKMIDDEPMDSEERTMLIEDIIRTSPTLQETVALFESLGNDYDTDLLNPLGKVKQCVSLKSKGLNLGAYLADLGYISSFEQTQEVIFYMSSARKLAEGIGVVDVYDDETAERLEVNISDQDSVVVMLTDLYWKTDAFLVELGRENISTLMIASGWVEAMYIAAGLMEQGYDSEKLYELFAAQAENLGRVNRLMAVHANDEQVADVYQQMQELDKLFDAIPARTEETDKRKAAIEMAAQKIREVREGMIRP